MATLKRSPLLLWAVLFSLCICYFFLHIAIAYNAGHDWGGDFSLYLNHTRNLIDGKPYAKTSYLYRDEVWQVGTSSFPVGLPLLLFPWYYAFGFDLEVFKKVCTGYVVLSLIPIFFLARRTVPPWLALVVGSAAVLNNLIVSDSIATEGPFLFFTSLFLVLFLESAERRWLDRYPVPAGLLLGSLGTFCYLIRSIGISIPVAVFVWLLWRRRDLWRFALAYLAAFLCLAFFVNLTMHADSKFSSQLNFDPRNWLSNQWGYFKTQSYFWVNYTVPYFRFAMVILLMPLMILGLWRRLREQGPSIVELYVAGTLGILTVYWIDNIRYFVPIFGIMMLWTAEGAVAMANGYLGSRKWRWTPVAVGLLIVCGLIGTLVNRPRRPVEQGVLNPGFLAAVRYVHTLPDTVRISFNNPRLLALYTNHLTAWFPKGSPDQVLQFLDNVGITHVVIIQEGDDDRYLGGAIRQFPQRFRAIFKEANCEIFEVRPAAS